MLQPILLRLIRGVLKVFVRPVLGSSMPLRLQRGYAKAMAKGLPAARSVVVTEVHGTSFPLWRISPEGHAGRPAAERPAIMWAHGGAFVTGGLDSHKRLASRIALACGADVYLPEYRLAPEHPAPAPQDDMYEAWQAMVAEGHDPSRIAIGGDSAGGGLAVSTALAIIDMDAERPVAMVLVSPLTDLSLSGPSIAEKASTDALLNKRLLELGRQAHAGDLTLVDPSISPQYADLGGLPPTLIQVGEDEILLSDAIRFSDRAWTAGVEVELQRYKAMFHDFQLFAGPLRAGDKAIAEIARFLEGHWRD